MGLDNLSPNGPNGPSEPLETPEKASGRPLRSSSVSSTSSSNGTPRRRTYHIAPVSVGGPKRSPRPSVSESVSPNRENGRELAPPGPLGSKPDEVATYMSQLAAKEARVGELREQLKNIELELQAAEFDLSSFHKSGNKLAQHLRSPPRRPLAQASTADLERGIRDSISRSPSPQRKPKESQVKRVVGEIGSQFWSFVEDVRTAALGEEGESASSSSSSSDSDSGKEHDSRSRRSRRSRHGSRSRRHRDPDPNQYL